MILLCYTLLACRVCECAGLLPLALSVAHSFSLSFPFVVFFSQPPIYFLKDLSSSVVNYNALPPLLFPFLVCVPRKECVCLIGHASAPLEKLWVPSVSCHSVPEEGSFTKIPSHNTSPMVTGRGEGGVVMETAWKPCFSFFLLFHFHCIIYSSIAQTCSVFFLSGSDFYSNFPVSLCSHSSKSKVQFVWYQTFDIHLKNCCFYQRELLVRPKRTIGVGVASYSNE